MDTFFFIQKEDVHNLRW